MRTTVLFLSLAFASLCLADPIISDTYTFPANTQSCSNASTCDVIANAGESVYYDIQKASLSVTGNTATVTLLFDYAYQAKYGSISADWQHLGTFTDAGLNLNVGDMFFYDPSDVGTNPAYSNPQYGVALVSHDIYSGSEAAGYTDPTNATVKPGALYSVTPATVLTAEQALTATSSNGKTTPSGVVYRNSSDVWINSSNLINNPLANAVTINYAQAPTAATASLKVTVQFNTTGTTLFSGSPVGFQFESADCANDIIDGTFSGYTPEPSSIFLAGGGLLLAGLGLLRRKRSA
jgi:hypothetical protein